MGTGGFNGGRTGARHPSASGLLVGLLLALFSSCVQAQQASPAPLARLLTLQSPLNEDSFGQVRRAILELQEAARQTGRKANLFLELRPGISQFHTCYGIADFLTRESFEGVTTIAWVPETVTGMNVLVALACQEIVLGPDAALGDMGNGQSVSSDEQAIVRTLVERRRNPRITLPLATALMDPGESLLQLTLDPGDGTRETRLVTNQEARRLQDDGAIILGRQMITETGTPGLISARQARARNVLIAQTAGTRKELIQAYQLPPDALDAPAPEAGKDMKVAYIELHDVIDEVFASFAERQIERAVASGAKLIIFEIDSPGGLLMVCADLSQEMAHLKERGIKTVAYIPNEAISGGAILAVACDEIYMRPSAKIGDAIPINLMGNMIVHAEAKILSVELELLRNLAAQKHRPAAVLEGFADKDLQVFEATNKTTGEKWYLSEAELQQKSNEWIAGPLVPESRQGIAIMVDGTRAHELLIAKAPVQDQTELKLRLGLNPETELKAIGRTWVDSLVFNLNRQGMTAILFFLAIVCIYLELATMTGFFGILSAICFAVFFWSKIMGGTAGGLELALFLVGMACLALELFVIPGFGVFGISGILLVLMSLIMAGQTFSGFSLEYDLTRAGQSMGALAAALLGVVVVSYFLSQHLHRLPLLRDMVLNSPGVQSPTASEPRLRPELLGQESHLVGAHGTAVTILRPAGKARIDGRIIDVVSDGPFIEAETPVIVVEVLKNRVVVRQA